MHGRESSRETATDSVGTPAIPPKFIHAAQMEHRKPETQLAHARCNGDGLFKETGRTRGTVAAAGGSTPRSRECVEVAWRGRKRQIVARKLHIA